MAELTARSEGGVTQLMPKKASLAVLPSLRHLSDDTRWRMAFDGDMFPALMPVGELRLAGGVLEFVASETSLATQRRFAASAEGTPLAPIAELLSHYFVRRPLADLSAVAVRGWFRRILVVRAEEEYLFRVANPREWCRALRAALPLATDASLSPADEALDAERGLSAADVSRGQTGADGNSDGP